ncbi:MAG: tetratricopeptide repeat protein [Deltaproteobacteria bacterium]|nr:tetratricopeptide repeat protein [Deltaproteobacteria bacterium]
MRRSLLALVLCGLILGALGCAEDRALLQKRARAREDLGLSYIQRGNVKLGLKHLREAARLDPENPDIQHELALAYKEMGTYEEALPHFKRALKLKPAFPEAWNNLGTLYLLLAKWDQAVECFQKAVDDITYRTPHFAYNNMGLAYYNKGDYERAIRSFQEALKLDPNYGLCRVNLGLAYEAAGRLGEALETNLLSQARPNQEGGPGPPGDHPPGQKRDIQRAGRKAVEATERNRCPEIGRPRRKRSFLPSSHPFNQQERPAPIPSQGCS